VYGLNRKAQTDADTGLPQEWTDDLVLIPLIAAVLLITAFFVIEVRSPHALLPIRVIADRTRAVSFGVMGVVGAALFAMFLFLSLFVQQVLGYSPLESGFAFLPFTVGIVVSAQIASALVSRVDPRWIVGAGGALAVLSMWGYSRLDVDSDYATGVLPWVVVQAVGMGLIFVPLTLTAVSRVDPADAGVGSAVLNTVQQVGGAVGIAVLGTVFANAITQRTPELVAGLGGQPTPEDLQQIALEAQTYGTSRAFIIAAFMLAAVTVVTLVGLNIRHEDLATDVTPGGAAALAEGAAVGAPPEIPSQPAAPADSADPATSGGSPGPRP
jgi:hypothetical protein